MYRLHTDLSSLRGVININIPVIIIGRVKMLSVLSYLVYLPIYFSLLLSLLPSPPRPQNRLFFSLLQKGVRAQSDLES